MVQRQSIANLNTTFGPAYKEFAYNEHFFHLFTHFVIVTKKVQFIMKTHVMMFYLLNCIETVFTSQLRCHGMSNRLFQVKKTLEAWQLRMQRITSSWRIILKGSSSRSKFSCEDKWRIMKVCPTGNR